MFNQLFGKYLVEQNVITDIELDVILTRQEDERLKLGTIAVAQNLMTEQQVNCSGVCIRIQTICTRTGSTCT